MGDDLKFKHPFTCIISGPTGSGKTSFCVKFLLNLDSLCTETNFDGGINWCYSEEKAVPSQQLASLKQSNIKYHEGVPDEIGGAYGRPSLLILDDLLNQVYSKKVCDLFTKGSHHRNVSVILITQNLFHQGRFCRDISLNAKYLVLLKNVRDKQQFSYLARQVYPEHSDSLYRA
jgi:ABC-type dipeptide/oligopeptide/nickel transport system ATPase subunit